MIPCEKYTRATNAPFQNAHRRQGSLLSALVVQPYTFPGLEININGGRLHDAASAIKACILLYAVFKNPDLAIEGFQSDLGHQVYRMIVHSNNTATSLVLAGLVDDPAEAVNAFNDFYHVVLRLPDSTGMTAWDYEATGGVTTDRIARPLDPITEYWINNPVTLDAFVGVLPYDRNPGGDRKRYH